MTPSPEDFTRLYRRHAQGMLLYFERRVLDAELARDLLADTFALAIDRGPQFRGSTPDELSGWLWAIARSVLAEQRRRDEDERRRRRRLWPPRNALTDREIERIEELAGLSALRETVAQRLAELPGKQSEAVRLHVVEELPYSEVARRMNSSEDTARARVSRGLRALNLALEDDLREWERDDQREWGDA